MEFLWLIENACFVITTSFHGTSFATIFHKPLLVVIQNAEVEDSRMHTLLRTLHQESSLVAYNSEISKDLIHSEEIITKEESLSAIRKRSEWLLVNSIKKVENGKNS